MPYRQGNPTSQALILSLIPIFFWSSNYVVMKWAAFDITMSVFTGLRFAVLLPLLLIFKKPDVPFLKIFLLSCVWLALNLYCIGRAVECGIDTGYLALGYVSSTVFVVIFSYFVNKEILTRFQMAGVTLAFAGIGIVAYSKGLDLNHLSGIGYLLLSNLFVAMGVTLLKKFNIPASLPLISWISALAAIPLFALSFIDMGASALVNEIFNLTQNTLYSVLYAAIGASFIGGLIWIDVINKLGANTSSFLTFLVPVFGLAFGAIFFDELISPEKMLAAFLVLSGVFLCVKKKMQVIIETV